MFQKKMIKNFALILSIVTVASSMSACGKAPLEVTNKEIVIEYMEAAKGELIKDGTYMGTIANPEAANVIVKMSGTVTEVNVKIGDEVSEGDLLCTIDDTGAGFKLDSAKASYNSAMAAYNSAKAGYNTAQANYDNAVASTNAQLGGSKTLTDYQTQSGIETIEKQLQIINENIEGYPATVDLTNSALAQVSGQIENLNKAVAAAKTAYEDAYKKHEIAVNINDQYGKIQVATNGNASADLESIVKGAGFTSVNEYNRYLDNSIVNEKNSALTTLTTQLANAQSSYSTLTAQSKTVNDGAITLKNNKEALEMSLEQAKKQQEIVNGEIYEDTLAVIDATKKVAQAAVDSANFGVAQAAVGLSAAQIGIDAAEYELSLYKTASPISGVVEQVNISVNNMASSDRVSFVISDPESKYVYFYVTPDKSDIVTIGQKVDITYNKKQYIATVDEIGNAIDSSTGMIRIRASISNGSTLMNGARVELKTKVYDVSDCIIIPWEAIYFEKDGNYVYVEENGKAVKKKIEMELFDGQTVAVKSGINEGENVIISWSQSLRDGATVRTAKEAN